MSQTEAYEFLLLHKTLMVMSPRIYTIAWDNDVDMYRVFNVGETMRERAKRQIKELIKTSTDKHRENVLTMAYDGYTYDDMISYVLIDGNTILSSDSVNELLQSTRQQCGDNYESYRKVAKIVVDSILKGE